MNAPKFFDLFRELETIVAARPTDESVARFSELVKEPVLYRYAFSALQDPSWIRVLASRDFFSSPPDPKRDLEKGTVAYPTWPASQFLARMSSKSPQLVCELIHAMPATENIMIHRDLLEAALVMPTRLAAEVGRKEKEWVEAQTKIFLMVVSMPLGKLIGKLARGRQQDVAFKLARSLFEIRPDPRLQFKPKEMRSLPQPNARLDVWEYGRALRSVIPELVEANHKETLTFTCDLLETAIRRSLLSEGSADWEDYSTIWCPVIEHPDAGAPDLKKTLVSAVWETLSLIAEVTEPVVILVQQLEARQWNIFRRIALVLLRKFPKSAPDLIAARLTDRTLFESSFLRSEYALLLKEQFVRLDEKQKQLILGWVEQGPDVDRYREAHQRAWGSPPAPEFVDRARKTWLREHLAPIHEFLGGQWRARYDEVVADLGKAEALEFAGPTGQWGWKPLGSEGAPDFSTLQVSEIVTYLKSRQPSEERGIPTPYGIGQILTGSVAGNPRRYAEQAEMFIGVHPTYISAILQGFDQALRVAEKKQFPWEMILRLCKWSVEQLDPAPGYQGDSTGADLNWGLAKNTIARLLSAGLQIQGSEIPYSSRETVWSVLNTLSRDPDPRSESNAIGTSDALTVSINSVRGNGMHAIIQYGLWVRRFLDRQPDAVRLVSNGFEEMAEVRQVLNDHLDPEKEQAVSIRAVYGQWLPWLVYLDPAWVKANVERIFIFTDDQRRFGEIAWNSYIVVCQAFDNVFDILRPQYERAVRELGPVTEGRSNPPDPREQLANHLMVFYWRGKLSLEDELLTSFYAKAGNSLLAGSLEFIGRSLAQADKIPEEVGERLKSLWSWRLRMAQSATSTKEYTRELAAFAWWFRSAKFDNIWSVEELYKSLQLLQDTTNLAPLVVDRLADISEEATLQCLHCLSLLVERDSEGMTLAGWEGQARKILSSGITATDANTRDFAEDVIHRLGASGYLSFQDLLPRKAS